MTRGVPTAGTQLSLIGFGDDLTLDDLVVSSGAVPVPVPVASAVGRAWLAALLIAAVAAASGRRRHAAGQPFR